METKRLYTLNQLAEMTGKNINVIRHDVANGKLHTTQLGEKIVRIEKEDAERYIKEMECSKDISEENDFKEYLTTKEVAKILKLDPHTVRQYIKNGVFESYKVDGICYIKKKDYFCEAFTVKEVEEMLSISHSVVLKWIKEGKLEAFNINPKSGRANWRISKKAIDSFLARS